MNIKNSNVNNLTRLLNVVAGYGVDCLINGNQKEAKNFLSVAVELNKILENYDI